MSLAGAPLLLHVFPTFAVGGAQVRFTSVANHFGPAYRHAIIALSGVYDCRERLSPGLDVIFPSVPIDDKRDTIGNLRRFRSALQDLSPDVLITSNWGAIEWAVANALSGANHRVRHLHIEDGFGPEERSRQIRRRVLTRRIVLRRSTVVLPSRALLRIAAEIWRLPAAALRYVPNGIDITRYGGPPDQAEAARWPAEGSIEGPAEGPVVGTVAALRPEKNLGRLLRAFRRLVDRMPARLVVAGDGPERRSLEALASALGLGRRVHFLGHVDRPEGAYRRFDLFALSSDTEQMPLSVIEAMASGLAVVATDVGDVRDMLAAENRGSVVGHDEAALAGAMESLLRDDVARQTVGAANRHKAERDFDQAVMFAAYGELFDEPRRA